MIDPTSPAALKTLPPNLRSWAHDAVVRGRSPKTISLYLNNARGVLAHTGKPDIDALTPQDMRDWLFTRRQQVSTATLSLEARSIAAILNWLVREGVIQRSPMATVEVPRADRKKQAILSQADLEKLIDAAKGTTLDRIRDTAMISMLIESGARVGELVSMTISGTDISEGKAYVRGKTGARAVPFGPATARAISKWLRVRSKYAVAKRFPDAIWLGEKGPLTVPGVEQALARASERAGLGRINPHLLRHTWADSMMRSDVPDRIVMTLGGWQSPAMLKVYAADMAEDRAFAAYRSPLTKRRS